MRRAKQANATNSPQALKSNPFQESKAPNDPASIVDEQQKAKVQVQLRASQLKDALESTNLTLTQALEDIGIEINTPVRTIKTPVKLDGETTTETYQVTTRYFSYEELVEHFIIDPENPRPEDERTEEALTDIIDEIGAGQQLVPIICYRNENNKIVILEGSRRHACAIIRRTGLWCELFNEKPSEAAALWAIEASDKKAAFTDLSLGSLYESLITKLGCTAKEFAEIKKINPATVSMRLNFHRAPVELKALLPSTKTTQRESQAFVNAARFITEFDLVNAASDYVTRALKERNFGNVDAEKVAVISALTRFVAEKKRESTSESKQPLKQKLYEKGNRTITWNKNGRSCSVNMSRLPVEWENELKGIIETFISTKQQSGE